MAFLTSVDRHDILLFSLSFLSSLSYTPTRTHTHTEEHTLHPQIDIFLGVQPSLISTPLATLHPIHPISVVVFPVPNSIRKMPVVQMPSMSTAVDTNRSICQWLIISSINGYHFWESTYQNRENLGRTTVPISLHGRQRNRTPAFSRSCVTVNRVG